MKSCRLDGSLLKVTILLLGKSKVREVQALRQYNFLPNWYQISSLEKEFVEENFPEVGSYL